MASPKVFASYSHDSPEHKKWVLHLCAQLRKNGVDVSLDQWDLGPGEDLTRFIESGVRDADKVIVICTPDYVEKANTRQRGVGYEGSMITAELYQNLETTKFIPIIRQSSGNKKTPDFLGTRVYIDFTDNRQFDVNFDELLRKIHQAPRVRKPPLGKNPFANQPAAPEASSSQLPEIPEKVESASETYEIAGAIIEANNSFRWRQLVKRLRPHAFQSLVQWRQKKLDRQPPGSIANRFQALNKAVDIVAPLISVSLAGVESENAQFNDQKSLLSNLLTIRGWQGDNTQSWHQTWVQIPYALGYVYHSLHGGLCLNTKQLPLALGLAREEVPFATGSRLTRVWENGHLMGYCQLMQERKGCWKYLANAYNQWEWLHLIFEDDFTYRASLVAYYMALSIHELAAEIAQPKSQSDIVPSVPWDFLSEEYEIKKHAVDLLHDNPALPALWECLGVTQRQMRAAWKGWRTRREDWLDTSDREDWLDTSDYSNYQPHEACKFLATTPREYLRFFDYWP